VTGRDAEKELNKGSPFDAVSINGHGLVVGQPRIEKAKSCSGYRGLIPAQSSAATVIRLEVDFGWKFWPDGNLRKSCDLERLVQQTSGNFGIFHSLGFIVS
jgi:hypothetical protein